MENEEKVRESIYEFLESNIVKGVRPDHVLTKAIEICEEEFDHLYVDLSQQATTGK